MTLSKLIARRIDEADEAAVFMQIGPDTLSYGDFARILRDMPQFFADLGLSGGMRLGILAHHPADVAALALSGFQSGVSVVVLNADSTADEISRIIRDCQLDQLFCDSDIALSPAHASSVNVTTFQAWPGPKPRGGLLSRLRRTEKSEGDRTIAAQAAAATGDFVFDPPQAHDTALMLNTSGTTSVPKVVELTQGNLAAQMTAFGSIYGLGPNSRLLNPLPLHFTDGLLHGPIHTFLTGATLYRPQHFDIRQLDDLLNGIYRDRITHFIVVPAILAYMDRIGGNFADSFDTPEFQFIRSSGDRLPESLWRSVEDRFNVRVVNTYGMSETVCEAFYCGPQEETRRLGTIGKAVGCDWRIMASPDVHCAPGETGELQLRGGLITKGYLGQSDLTAKAFEGEWFKTGDLATADDEGFVTLVGRGKDLIITGGMNVQPQEVADCLLSHQSISDVAVVGLPHTVWGEQIGAAVVPRDGASVETNTLLAHCRENLAGHKVPRVLAIMQTLPRNAAGKILAHDVQQALLGKDTSEGSAGEGSVAEQVLAEAGRVFGVDAATLHLSNQPDDVLGWDSFAHLTLITALEERFGMTFTARDVLRVDRLSDLVEVVVSKQDNLTDHSEGQS